MAWQNWSNPIRSAKICQKSVKIRNFGPKSRFFGQNLVKFCLFRIQRISSDFTDFGVESESDPNPQGNRKSVQSAPRIGSDRIGSGFGSDSHTYVPIPLHD